MTKSWMYLTDNQNRSTFQYNYYDHSLRPTNTVHKIALDNSWGVFTPDRLVSSLKYNFRDQLIEKNIGGVYNTATSSYKYTQSLDFQYNIRNWLPNINSGDLSSPTGKEYPLFSCANYNSFYNYTGQYSTPPLNGEDNPDLFTQVLRYDNPTIAIGNVPQQGNGNISQIEWQVAGREKQAYSFKYDKLNRLTEANYTDIHTGAWSNNGWAAQYEQNDKYKEALTYDQRGNIKTLLRSGSLYNSTSPNGLLCSFNGTIDNLQYTYNDKNQVTAISDAADLTKGFKTIANGGIYSYDANGNMIADPNKGISNIEYNYLNLPMRITFTVPNMPNRSIDIIYDATGKKWRKVVKETGQPDKERDYIQGAEYQNGVQDIIHFTEGYVERDATTDGDANRKGWVYKYTLKDQLAWGVRSPSLAHRGSRQI